MWQVTDKHQEYIQVHVTSQTRNIQHDSVKNHVQHQPRINKKDLCLVIGPEEANVMFDLETRGYPKSSVPPTRDLFFFKKKLVKAVVYLNAAYPPLSLGINLVHVSFNSKRLSSSHESMFLGCL